MLSGAYRHLIRTRRSARTRSPAVVVLGVLVAASFVPVPASGEPARRDPTPTPTPDPNPTLPDLLPTPTPTPSPTRSREPEGGGPTEEPPDDGGRDRRGGRDKPVVVPPPPGERVEGSYRTLRLVGIAARLRALGWSEADVVEGVYPPFIVAGNAAWSDTWGAPRFGPGPLVRWHEGQDVFCEYGAPVLAAQDGVIEFGSQVIGGLIARLHRPDGTYWYYAHLSDHNTGAFSSGDRVETGDVIGYCGTSGNAEFTPPHVHFGWYGREGARNPMTELVAWLRAAQVRAADLYARVTGQRVRRISELRTARRFGDAFAPDRSELPNPGESLWASGAAPAAGAFGVAQVALQEALSRATDIGTGGPGVPDILGVVLPANPPAEPVSVEASGVSSIGSDALAELLRSSWLYTDGAG